LKFKGNVKHITKVSTSKLAASSRRALLEQVQTDLIGIHGLAVKSIQAKSMGEVVTRYNPKRMVTVSAPEDPPNTDLGTFVKSIQFNVKSSSLEGQVGTNDPRGPWFEFGTATMAPRPWLEPAFKAWMKARRKFKWEVDG
jgi:hypothetical protein